MGATCTGTGFDYTTTTSGIFQVEAVFFGDTNNAVHYIRKSNEYKNGIRYGIGLKGQNDSIGIVDDQIQLDILTMTKPLLTSTEYSTSSALIPPAGYGQSKCNIFVAHMCNNANAPVPSINWTQNHASLIPPYMWAPPVANQWAGFAPPVDFQGWPLLPENTFPQPGYVVAHGAPGNTMGHCGILDYDGGGIAAGDSYGVSKLYIFLQSSEPSRMRKYAP